MGMKVIGVLAGSYRIIQGYTDSVSFIGYINVLYWDHIRAIEILHQHGKQMLKAWNMKRSRGDEVGSLGI